MNKELYFRTINGIRDAFRWCMNCKRLNWWTAIMIIQLAGSMVVKADVEGSTWLTWTALIVCGMSILDRWKSLS